MNDVTPIPKRGPAEAAKPASVRRVSPKMRAQHGREARCKDLLRRRSHGRCEACARLHDGPIRPGVDKHEIKSRGRGGDPCDPENCLLVCRPCHDWIEANDADAVILGLSAHSWD